MHSHADRADDLRARCMVLRHCGTDTTANTRASRGCVGCATHSSARAAHGSTRLACYGGEPRPSMTRCARVWPARRGERGDAERQARQARPAPSRAARARLRAGTPRSRGGGRRAPWRARPRRAAAAAAAGAAPAAGRGCRPRAPRPRARPPPRPARPPAAPPAARPPPARPRLRVHARAAGTTSSGP